MLKVVTAEEIKAAPRGSMSAKRRHHIFSEHCTGHNVAPCCLCGQPIHRHDDKWIIEHLRALGLLGKDTNANCGPAHEACAKDKTFTQDLPRIAHAKRQNAAAVARDEATLQAKKKPARGFQVPAGAKYSWKWRRYVKKPTDELERQV
jgi:hypothetical protein